jgi:hypothetical protein
MGLSSTYIFYLDRLSLKTLVEISPLGLGREFYLEVLGIGDGEMGRWGDGEMGERGRERGMT